MTDSSDRSSKRESRKWGRRTRILILLLLLVCAALYLGRETLVHPSVASLLKRLALRHGYELTLADLQSNWFNSVALRGVALRARSTEAALDELHAAELVVRYSLPRLLRQGIPEGLSIEIDSASLALDFTHRKSGKGKRGDLAIRLPALAIRDSSIELAFRGDRQLSFEGIGLSTHAENAGDLQVDRATLQLPGRPALEAEGAASVRLLPGKVVAERIELKCGDNLVRAQDLHLRLANGSPERVGDLLIELVDIPAVLRPFVSLERLPELPEHKLRIHGRGSSPEGGSQSGPHERLVLESGTLETPLGTVEARRANLSLRQWPPPWQAELQVTLDDLAVLGERAGFSCQGSAEGTVLLESAGRDLRTRFLLDGQDLVVRGQELGQASLAGSHIGGVLELERLWLTAPWLLLEARGSYEVASGRAIGMAVQAELLDLPTSLGETSSTFALECPLSLEASVEGPLKQLSGTASLRSEAVALSGERVSDLRCEARLEPEAWTVERFSLQSRIGPVEARGRLSNPLVAMSSGEFDLRLDELSIGSIDGEQEKLRLVRPFHAILAGDRWSAHEISMQGSAGEIELSLEGTAEQSRAHLAAAGFFPQAFIPERLNQAGGGGLDFELDFVRSGTNLTVSSRGSAAQLTLGELASSLRWSVSLGDGSLRVDQLDIHATRDGQAELQGWLHGNAPLRFGEGATLGDGPIDFRGAWRLSMTGDRAMAGLGPDGFLQGEFLGDLALAGTWNAPIAELIQRGEEIYLRKGERQLGPCLLDLALRLDRGLEIERGELLLAELGSVSLEGRWDLESDFRQVLSAGEAGLRATPIELLAQVDLADLSVLCGWTEALRRCEGKLGASLACTGTLEEPRFEGTIELEEAAARFASDLPPFQRVNAVLRVQPEGIAIEELSGEIGAAPFSASGQVELGEAGPTLALRLEASRILLVRSEAVRIRADANLAVNGPLGVLSIEGNLTLRDSRVYQSIDLLSLLRADSRPAGPRGLGLFSLRSPVLSTLQFDVNVGTAEPIDLRSNLARGLVSMDLHLGGTGEVPLPSGRIFVEDLDLRLPAGIVTFDSGLVVFEEKNPFVPTLDLPGKTRLAGYDISIHVEGPYDQPEVELSSTPPLQGEDMLTLLLTGRPPAADLRETGKSASQSIAVYLARDWLRQLSGEDFNDESFLDRFQFVTGRDVSKGGSLTTEASVRVAQGAFAEKDTLFLVGERDVYEEYNFGVRILFRFP